MRQWMIALLAVTITGCGATKDLTDGPNGYDPSLYGWNMTAGPLLFDSVAGSAQFDHYLAVLESKGAKKQVRIIAPHGWGETKIEPLWLPVIRARGWKALVIVSQESADTQDREQAIAWVRHLLDTWGDVIIGIQPGNEPYHDFEHWTPADYLVWHRLVATEAKARHIPVVTGDFGPGYRDKAMGFYAKAGLNWATDVDVFSLHVTGDRNSGDLRDFLRQIPTGLPIWITEGDWSQRTVIPAAETYVYTCIGAGGGLDGSSSLNRCPAMEAK